MPIWIRIWKKGDPPMTNGGWTGRFIGPSDSKAREPVVEKQPNAEPRGEESESEKASGRADEHAGA
jgi:hypothetical protein